MQDYFTIELQTPTGQLLPSIEYDSHRWFVAEPGQEFVVQVSMVIYTATGVKSFAVHLWFARVGSKQGFMC
jgi:hypothetical protein